jgi:predicted Zn-dependent protease
VNLKSYFRLKNKKMKLIYFFQVLVLVVFLTTCAKNPVTGKREVMLISEADEIKLGAESDPEILAEFGVLENPDLQVFINEKGNEMAKISHRSSLPFHFKILDSPVVNAFALPGGYVYFTRGILAHFNNEAQFSGVLGHEIGHVTARHGANQYSKQMLAQLGLAIGSSISKELEAFAQIAGVGVQLLFMKFGRADESQSDELGVEYATKTGYDCVQMADFFKTLDKLGGGAEGRMPAFLSTHPAPLDRFEKVGELTKTWQDKYPSQSFSVNRESYLRRIDGLPYGEDPQQGFVEKEVFYHPALAFYFPVPKDWNLTNAPANVTITEKSGKSMVIFDLAKGNNFDAALKESLEDNDLILVKDKKRRINGFQAMEADLTQKTPNSGAEPLTIKLTLIQDGEKMFRFLAIAQGKEVSAFFTAMDKTVNGFSRLNDSEKLNRKVELIQIVNVKKSGSLSDVLAEFKMPVSRHKELAVLNGMELTDKVSNNMLIKIVKNLKPE